MVECWTLLVFWHRAGVHEFYQTLRRDIHSQRPLQKSSKISPASFACGLAFLPRSMLEKRSVSYHIDLTMIFIFHHTSLAYYRAAQFRQYLQCHCSAGRGCCRASRLNLVFTSEQQTYVRPHRRKLVTNQGLLSFSIIASAVGATRIETFPSNRSSSTCKPPYVG